MLENLLTGRCSCCGGRGTIAFTLLCGLYFTVFTHFLPLRKIGLVTQKTLGSLFCKKNPRTAFLPCRCQYRTGRYDGVGNIIGVGAALALRRGQHLLDVGRALLGMMTKYMEVFLAVRWRCAAPVPAPSAAVRCITDSARHPTSHRQAVGGAVLHLLYPLEPVQRQHGPDQRHRPVDAAELFGFPLPCALWYWCWCAGGCCTAAVTVRCRPAQL